MANGALHVALGQGRSPVSRSLVERFQNVLALQAAFLFAIEHDDIAMNNGLKAELVSMRARLASNSPSKSASLRLSSKVISIRYRDCDDCGFELARQA